MSKFIFIFILFFSGCSAQNHLDFRCHSQESYQWFKAETHSFTEKTRLVEKSELGKSELEKSELGKSELEKSELERSELEKSELNKRDKNSLNKISSKNKSKGVALVIHGLNLKPEKMQGIISHLTASGMDVLNLSLCGHGKMKNEEERLESFKEVNYELWMDEVALAYRIAQERSKQKQVPLLFVGYSLGGVLGVDFLLSQKEAEFSKMLLFAPALQIHWRSYGLKLFSLFPRLVIPSLSPEEYRANDGTPMAAYNALYQTINSFEQKKSQKLNIPTWIFMDREDELVSYKKIEHLIQSQKLDQWKLYPVERNLEEVEISYRHLMIDQESLGDSFWKKMMLILSDFVNK